MALSLALTLIGNLIVALFVVVCTALILIILLQKGRGGGIGAAFGGAGGAGSLLGTKTGDFLTWVTICLVAGFLVLAVLMGKFMRPQGTSSDLSAPLGTQTPTVDESAAADTETPEAPVDTTAAAGVAEETTPVPETATDDVVNQPAGDDAPKPEASNENE
ncbi:MAG: preprotein translocase subunit SecG [Planctomycetota bacterium]|jgi:preprotein translocase subunit SecG